MIDMPNPIPTGRFRPTPAWLIYGLLVVEGLLWVSERWFPKGWAVLIAVAVVGATMLVMLGWCVDSLTKRWPFQFSNRSLLVLTVAVALSFSWLAVEMKTAREQKQTIERIRGLGGGVWYVGQENNFGIPRPLPGALLPASDRTTQKQGKRPSLRPA
jgi:hypothetical protein